MDSPGDLLLVTCRPHTLVRWRSDGWVPDDPLEVLWDGSSLCDEGKEGEGSKDESSADGEGSHGLGYL